MQSFEHSLDDQDLSLMKMEFNGSSFTCNKGCIGLRCSQKWSLGLCTLGLWPSWICMFLKRSWKTKLKSIRVETCLHRGRWCQSTGSRCCNNKCLCIQLWCLGLHSSHNRNWVPRLRSHCLPSRRMPCIVNIITSLEFSHCVIYTLWPSTTRRPRWSMISKWEKTSMEW